jgi:hypothetical protein
MPKPRSAATYRLSEDAKRCLEVLSERLGLPKTRVLEMAIRKLAFAELGNIAEDADVEDPKVVLPPGLRSFRLSEQNAQMMQQLLDDPQQLGRAGKEMSTADPSVLVNNNRSANG